MDRVKNKIIDVYKIRGLENSPTFEAIYFCSDAFLYNLEGKGLLVCWMGNYTTEQACLTTDKNGITISKPFLKRKDVLSIFIRYDKDYIVVEKGKKDCFEVYDENSFKETFESVIE